ncbi:hypothetical protein BDY24DRAFT_411213 [Mrakia frigida]|uniref:uncharacterized protein n=1 Tax=Mrakia frigida TaxID=29902 RepID=UPI003FCBF1F7
MDYPYGYGRPLPSNHSPSAATCTDEEGTAILKTSRTQRNPNRDFVACNEGPFSCDFFKWVDEFPNPSALTQVRQQPPKPQTLGAAPRGQRIVDLDVEEDDVLLQRALEMSRREQIMREEQTYVLDDDSEVEIISKSTERGGGDGAGGKGAKRGRWEDEDYSGDQPPASSSSKLYTPPSKVKTQESRLLAAANKKIDSLQRENKRLRKENKQLEKDYSRMTDDFMTLNAEKIDWEEERDALRMRVGWR